MPRKFATAINCIDGRVQKPVIAYMQRNLNIDYVDMITEPGPNKVLSENKDTIVINYLKKKVEISVNNHNSQIIAIAAHYDCSGNPGNDNKQKEQLLKSIDTIISWKLPVRKIIALWLDEGHQLSVVKDIDSVNFLPPGNT